MQKIWVAVLCAALLSACTSSAVDPSVTYESSFVAGHESHMMPGLDMFYVTSLLLFFAMYAML